jgi:hypothetical protein
MPSLQAVPFGLFGFEQFPVLGSQVPAVWHWSGVGHCRAVPAVQTPSWQASLWVQALLSVQAVPLGLIGFEQAPVEELHDPTSWH